MIRETLGVADLRKMVYGVGMDTTPAKTPIDPDSVHLDFAPIGGYPKDYKGVFRSPTGPYPLLTMKAVALFVVALFASCIVAIGMGYVLEWILPVTEYVWFIYFLAPLFVFVLYLAAIGRVLASAFSRSVRLSLHKGEGYPTALVYLTFVFSAGCAIACYFAYKSGFEIVACSLLFQTFGVVSFAFEKRAEISRGNYRAAAAS